MADQPTPEELAQVEAARDLNRERGAANAGDALSELEGARGVAEAAGDTKSAARMDKQIARLRAKQRQLLDGQRG